MLRKMMDPPVIYKLAAALQATFWIEEGFELGYMLGIREGFANSDVLIHWIGQTLQNPDSDLGYSILPALVDRFEATLRREEVLPW